MNKDINWYKVADDWFEEEKVWEIVNRSKEDAKNLEVVGKILDKAALKKGLSHQEAVTLLYVEDEELIHQIERLAKEIKESIYGKRIVLFAPLYVSDYCVNGCEYCGYKHSNNHLKRKKLNMQELEREVIALENMGHKRLALELGEDPINTPIDYTIECIRKIYSIKLKSGQIRRINVNIAATSIEEYKMLKEAEIGTYVLFQETYHKPTYEKVHPIGPKHNYSYHTSAFHRAMMSGIDDVGAGVLFGLYDYGFEVTSLLMHAEKLEKDFGVGPHTVSVPRLKEAENVTLKQYPHIVSDEVFKRIVMVLRLAMPYTGIIMSTRENQETRREVLELGVSQMSAGSCTGVGGYQMAESEPQFKVGDHRTPLEVIKELIKDHYIPSYCTACYREGRTGERFMGLAKGAKIGKMCTPNALLTLQEYILDYGDEEVKVLGEQLIEKVCGEMEEGKIHTYCTEALSLIRQGQRDLRV